MYLLCKSTIYLLASKSVLVSSSELIGEIKTKSWLSPGGTLCFSQDYYRVMSIIMTPGTVCHYNGNY